MAIVPIRSDNAYFGFSKQSSQGVPVAPSLFPRWIDGSQIEYDMKTEEVWEGDGTRHLSLVIKNQQSVKIKLVCNPRPVELGFFEAMSMGLNADTVTASTINTTTSGGTNNAGSTTLVLASNTGLTGSGTSYVMVDAGVAGKEEVVAITTPGTGAGPYTYTIANSGTLKFTHTAGATAQGPSVHTMVDGTDSAFYTVEVGIGSLSGAAGATFRVTDCKVDQIKRSSKAGKLLVLEVDLIGIATNIQGGPSTVTLETRQPFMFVQGAWTLNGSTTGDALAFESFEITQKNGLDPIQTEAITLASVIFGNFMATASLDLVYQNNNLVALTYFGSTAGLTDNQNLGYGSLIVVFTQADLFHSVQYNVPQLAYTKDGVPQPKKDGKHMIQKVTGSGTTNSGTSAFVVQTTVNNVQRTAY